MDCFASLAMTSRCTSAISRRVAPEPCKNPSAQEMRAWGTPGAQLAPAASRAKWEVSTRAYSPQLQPDSPGVPARNGFNGLLRALPGDRLVCHRHRRIWLAEPGRADFASANLTPASGRQDHTTSPSASAPFVCAPCDRSRETRPAIPVRAGAAASIASRAQRP
jgi:hypothetical protein